MPTRLHTLIYLPIRRADLADLITLGRLHDLRSHTVWHRVTRWLHLQFRGETRRREDRVPAPPAPRFRTVPCVTPCPRAEPTVHDHA